MAFVVYYLLEQSFKLWALGWKRYSFEKGNLFDGFITIILVVSTLHITCGKSCHEMS